MSLAGFETFEEVYALRNKDVSLTETIKDSPKKVET